MKLISMARACSVGVATGTALAVALTTATASAAGSGALPTLAAGAASSPQVAVSVRTVHATTADGSRIVVQVPTPWNGTLALYSHGYRSPIDGATSAQDASTSSTGKALLDQGYALAGSSYPRNGWAVAEGVHADELLLSWFKRHVASPHRVYVWGDSLGGLVTETFAEEHPSLISAAAPMCGVLAGSDNNLDEALDVAVALKALLLPHLKLTGFTSYKQASAVNDQALAAIEAGLASANATTQARFASRVLAIAALVDSPRKTQHFDGVGLTNSVGAAVEGLGNALFYGTVGRYDIEKRVGGNPSTNIGVDYRTRISKADLSWWQGFGLSGSLLHSYAKTVQYFGQRVKANATARAKFGRLGNPTGLLGKPTVTMHTEDDPLVIVQNESVFSRRVTNHDRSGRLLQLFIKPPATYQLAPYGAGHCVFTDGDRVALIHTLDAWLAHGSRPTPSQVAAIFPDGEGLDLGYRPAWWPTR